MCVCVPRPRTRFRCRKEAASPAQMATDKTHGPREKKTPQSLAEKNNAAPCRHTNSSGSTRRPRSSPYADEAHRQEVALEAGRF